MCGNIIDLGLIKESKLLRLGFRSNLGLLVFLMILCQIEGALIKLR